MKKVLLVSEYRVFLQRNTNLLMKRGLQLFNTTNGEEALKLHDKHHFDLILSDFKLEDMVGIKLCSLIRKKELSRDVIILLTCQNLKSRIELVENCGATAIILKPIDPVKLLKTIGSFLDVQLVRNHRVELRVKVSCKDQNLEFFCLSHDVSNTGILIETEQHLELEDRILFQFTLPPSYQIEAEGKVIRSTREMNGAHLYGVRFVDIQMSSQREIFNYVNSIKSSMTDKLSIDYGDSLID